MKITSIELAGSVAEGKKLPRAFARIARTTDSDYIEATILKPGGQRKQMARANCRTCSRPTRNGRSATKLRPT